MKKLEIILFVVVAVLVIAMVVLAYGYIELTKEHAQLNKYYGYAVDLSRQLLAKERVGQVTVVPDITI